MKKHQWTHSKNNQSLLQRTCFYMGYPKDFYYLVKNLFLPQQRWIKKFIKYHSWCDKTGLIPDFIFGCIIHFVEEEGCFEIIDWESDGEHSDASKIIREVYEYAKYGRNKDEQKYLDKLREWSEVHSFGLENFEDGSVKMINTTKDKKKEKILFEELSIIEKEKEKREKQMVEKVISILPFLWV